MKSFFDLFNNIYIETTDPSTNYTRLFSYDITISILFHTVFYMLIVYVISFIFNTKISNNSYKKLFCILILVMTIGYILRLCRVKSLHDLNPELLKAVRQTYFTFYFFA